MCMCVYVCVCVCVCVCVYYYRSRRHSSGARGTYNDIQCMYDVHCMSMYVPRARALEGARAQSRVLSLSASESLFRAHCYSVVLVLVLVVV